MVRDIDIGARRFGAQRGTGASRHTNGWSLPTALAVRGRTLLRYMLDQFCFYDAPQLFQLLPMLYKGALRATKERLMIL